MNSELKKNNFKREFSAGCVVYKREKGEKLNAKKAKIKFLLGKHSGYHKWVLPKGLIEEGEKGWQTALRETEEEMGVKTRLVDPKPIHKVQYYYVADFRKLKTKNEKRKTIIKNSKLDKRTRRVMVYQEQGGNKVKVFKTVSFYLTEYKSGDSKEHGWEMSEAAWFDYNEALKLMAFDGEKEALKKAQERLSQIEKQPQLL